MSAPCHGQAVFDRCDPRGRPRRVFDRAALAPGADVTFKNDLVTAPDAYANRIRFNLRMPFEGGIDPALHIRRIDLRLDDNHVGNAAYARQFTNVVFRRGLLKMPVHIAAQREPSVMNQYIDRVRGNKDVPLQDIVSSLGDLIICSLFLIGTVHLDILRDGVYALDATGGGYGCELFRVAVDVPAEGHNAFVDGDANVLAAEARIKFKLCNDVLPESRVGHDRSSEDRLRFMTLRFRGDHLDPRQGRTDGTRIFVGASGSIPERHRLFGGRYDPIAERSGSAIWDHRLGLVLRCEQAGH